MKITDKEWTTITTVLENRSYKYSDSDDSSSDEYKTFKNINNRIQKNTDNSILRFNTTQKNYLEDMLSTYQSINCMNMDQVNIIEQDEYNNCQSIIDKL